ncbi:MAG: hypothetical protein HFE98_10375 [Ruminiclostridium sp.]|jgi:hypothetical protein|nr:hypothetical protein [Ruminiclostridium sp.]MCI9466224.1 hypothetical protein [Ruminiclostridium sp.]
MYFTLILTILCAGLSFVMLALTIIKGVRGDYYTGTLTVGTLAFCLLSLLLSGVF